MGYKLRTDVGLQLSSPDILYRSKMYLFMGPVFSSTFVLERSVQEAGYPGFA